MGVCFSSAPKQLIENTDGGEDAYHKRYMEGEVLGEGEFGQVRLVHDMTQTKDQNTPYASKVLKKGMVFKDNTLYSPIKVSSPCCCLSRRVAPRRAASELSRKNLHHADNLYEHSPKSSAEKSKFSKNYQERIIVSSS